jgi:GSH-dependent disulfide-bond oxidoreductase
MIDLYSWQSSNGRKVSIALEEMALEYAVHPINIGADDQFSEAFTAINPNQKIPAIVDSDGPGGAPIRIFESGAILIYLARKSGKFLPSDERDEIETLQWLMFQMGGIGPTFGQVHHFKRAAKEPVPYALERYGKECLRLYDVLDKHLAENEYIAARQYTIADMAIFPWVARFEWQEVELQWFENVQRWYELIEQRPAVQRGMLIPARP